MKTATTSFSWEEIEPIRTQSERLSYRVPSSDLSGLFAEDQAGLDKGERRFAAWDLPELEKVFNRLSARYYPVALSPLRFLQPIKARSERIFSKLLARLEVLISSDERVSELTAGNLLKVLLARDEAQRANALTKFLITERIRTACLAYHFALLLVGLEREEESLKYAQQAVQIEPDLAEAWLLMTRIQFKMGSLAEALPAFYKTSELFARDQEVLRSMLPMVTGKARLELLLRLKNLSPGTEELDRLLARESYHQSKFGEALEFFLNMDQAELSQEERLWFGVCLAAQGQEEEAGEILTDFLTGPKDSSLMTRLLARLHAGGVEDQGLVKVLARRYFDQGDHAACLELCQRIPPLERDERLVLMMAECYNLLGRHEDTLDLLEAEDHPWEDQIKRAYLLGVALFNRGRLVSARSKLSRALASPELKVSALKFLAAIASRLEETGQAAGLYRRLSRLVPEERVLAKAAWAALRAGMDLLAQEVFSELLELAPDCYLAWNNLGVLNARAENLEEAAKCFKRALDLKPDLPEAATNLALVYDRVLAKSSVHYLARFAMSEISSWETRGG